MVPRTDAAKKANDWNISWLLHDKCYNTTEILVAVHEKQYRLVCEDLSTMSDPKDTKRAYTTGCHNSSSIIRKSLHGYYAYAIVEWIQIHCARLMLVNALC